MLSERIPSMERVRFTASGTEATMFAVRLARAFTGKTTFARMEGSYHGLHDMMSSGMGANIGQPWPGMEDDPVGYGVPPRVRDEVAFLPFNDLEGCADVMAEHAGTASRSAASRTPTQRWCHAMRWSRSGRASWSGSSTSWQALASKGPRSGSAGRGWRSRAPLRRPSSKVRRAVPSRRQSPGAEGLHGGGNAYERARGAVAPTAWGSGPRLFTADAQALRRRRQLAFPLVRWRPRASRRPSPPGRHRASGAPRGGKTSNRSASRAGPRAQCVAAPEGARARGERRTTR